MSTLSSSPLLLSVMATVSGGYRSFSYRYPAGALAER